MLSLSPSQAEQHYRFVKSSHEINERNEKSFKMKTKISGEVLTSYSQNWIIPKIFNIPRLIITWNQPGIMDGQHWKSKLLSFQGREWKL